VQKAARQDRQLPEHIGRSVAQQSILRIDLYRGGMPKQCRAEISVAHELLGLGKFRVY